MREPPPPQLIALLERLGLAGAGDVCRMDRRVRRLARDLPRFESVWVDALAQARVLTPFQAAEINAGRGERLRVGPYLLCGSLPRPNYVAGYRARRVDSGRAVRLFVAESAGGWAEQIVARLQTLAAASAELRCEQLAPITEAGADGNRIWAASPWVEGRTAAEWIVHNGRFPPQVVLEIARAMLTGLATLERAGFCHGDVSATGLALTDSGGVVLLQPGLRAILRPEEGFAHADLLPEAYDYLAPERIAEGTPPTIAGDVYACGCVWWQMLCGRPPLPGGDSLGKLRAAQAAKVPDVRRLAPEVPGELGAAVSACLQREPSRRPESMARLAALLGPPTRAGRRALAQCLALDGASSLPRRMGGRRRSPGRWPVSPSMVGRAGRLPMWLAATAGCLAAVAAVLWPICRSGLPWERVHQRSIATKLPGNGPALPGNAPALPGEGPALPGGVADPSETSGKPRSPGRGSPDEIADGAVVAAHYQVRRPPPAMPHAATPEDLVLDSGGPLRIETLAGVRAGQCVRGSAGTRPMVMVPRTGLVVGAEDLRFENVDFIWDHVPQADDAVARQAAVVHLCSARAEFRGCSFQSTRRLSAPPVAVRWTHPVPSKDSELALPSGRVRLSDCLLRQVDAGVDCRTVGALAVELTNTLQLGIGPLVRLDHCPGADEPVLVALEQVTLRGAGPVLECRCQGFEGQPGEISIEADRCAFVPAPGVALLLFTASPPFGRASSSPPDGWPRQILRNVRWTGQGSLVSPEAVIAAWRGSEGGQQVLDEAAVSIDGLVRSEVGFAGGAGDGAAASRIIRWQAPLRSTDPPGINPAALPEGGSTVGGP